MLFSTASYSGDLYGGIQYSKVDYSESGLGLDFSTVGAIAGYELTNAFAIEARYSKGQSDDSAFGVGFEVDNTYGVYGVVSLPNETNIEPYVVIGYTKGKLSASGYGSESESDFSYGAGISFKLAESLSIRTEYMVLLDKEDYEFNSVSASLIYKF